MIKKEWIQYLNLKVISLFIIECVYHNNQDLLKTALKLDEQVNPNLETLLSKGILIKEGEWYALSEQYEEYMYSKKEITAPKTPQKVNINELVTKYRELFPKGINSNGFPYRGDKQGTTKKLAKFLKTNTEYDEKIILKATEKYINEKRKDNFAYMKLAHYFIEKDGVSDLGAFCEQVLNGDSPQDYENILNL